MKSNRKNKKDQGKGSNKPSDSFSSHRGKGKRGRGFGGAETHKGHLQLGASGSHREKWERRRKGTIAKEKERKLRHIFDKKMHRKSQREGGH